MKNLYKNSPFAPAFVVFLAILLLSRIFSNESRIKILNIFRMPMKLASGSYYVLRDVADFKALRNENKILNENIASLKKEMVKLQESHLENERLKGLLGFKERSDVKVIPAMVIARDPLILRDMLIIDKGRRDGVEKGMAIISGGGLVGRVRETGQSISRVLLITDPDSVVSGIVQRTREEGAVTGLGGSKLIMKYLDINSDVKEGDKVITSGFGGIFQKGILIGEIVSLTSDPRERYGVAKIKPEVDIMRLEEVLVMSE